MGPACYLPTRSPFFENQAAADRAFVFSTYLQDFSEPESSRCRLSPVRFPLKGAQLPVALFLLEAALFQRSGKARCPDPGRVMVVGRRAAPSTDFGKVLVGGFLRTRGPQSSGQLRIIDAELLNGSWPGISALCRDLLYFTLTAHTPDRMASLLFARWAGDSSRQAQSGRIGLLSR